MGAVTVIGLDIAKSVFQVHGIDAAGTIVIQRQIRRGQVLTFFASLRPCLVGIEACATAHHWSRELQHLGHCARSLKPGPYSGPDAACKAGASATRPLLSQGRGWGRAGSYDLRLISSGWLAWATSGSLSRD